MTTSEFSRRINCYIKGDKKSFDKIFEIYYHKLVGAAYLVLHDKFDSQNVASDIFEQILTNPTAFQHINNPSSYLFTAAQNRAKNVLQKQKLTIKELSVSVKDFSDETVERIDFYRLLEQYFKPTEQEILILRCVWDLTYSEISRRMNIPLGTIKSKFRSFKAKLKTKLKDNHRSKL